MQLNAKYVLSCITIHYRFLVPDNTQKILTEIWHHFWLKMMMKNGLEKIILKFHDGLQSCCCPVQKILPRKAELAWQVSRYLWRPPCNFKIIFSRPLFIIIFKPKMVSNLGKNFLCIVSHQKPTVQVNSASGQTNVIQVPLLQSPSSPLSLMDIITVGSPVNLDSCPESSSSSVVTVTGKLLIKNPLFQKKLNFPAKTDIWISPFGNWKENVTTKGLAVGSRIKVEVHESAIFCHLNFFTVHRGAFCQFLFRWIYYYGSNKCTGKETDKTHLCALRCIEGQGTIK